ncbi:Ras-interacting protein 1 [Clarias magur]|uniref:Ras-interacting protein 1 n=1 Tax=Clarias magur TaxID=1594786 RepID=A0A8J4URA4_CLAMG|nr:Ras-interacting protein 1 [Clarias magur]
MSGTVLLEEAVLWAEVKGQDCLNLRLSSYTGMGGDVWRAEAVFPEKTLLIRDMWRKKRGLGCWDMYEYLAQSVYSVIQISCSSNVR